MRIGIDLDNCLNNLNFVWLDSYNLGHNDNLTLEDIKSWDIHKYTKIGSKMYDYLNKDLLETLKPLPYAVEVTKRLAKNHELFIVTASFPRELETKFNWIKKYFPHISTNNIIVCQRKDMVNVGLLIDDASHNIVDFPNHTIVLDYPWNRDLGERYIRASNWKEIEGLVESIDKANGEENTLHAFKNGRWIKK